MSTILARVQQADRSVSSKQDRVDLERRRREVKQILAAGVASVQFPLNSKELQHDGYADRLRDLLISLGPVFSTFGRYVASRPDLLCLPDCVALSRIPDVASASPKDLVWDVVKIELESMDHSISTHRFVRLDSEPFESRLLYQLHHGELQNGDLVVVKMIHPEIDFEIELRVLPLLLEVVGPLLSDPEQFEMLIEDFERSIRDAFDCRRTADSLERLSHDTRDSDFLTVPKVYVDLCSRNILITERMDGIRLDRYIAHCQERAELNSGSAATVDGFVPDELARHLVDHWLTQAFHGTMLPVEMRPEHILIRSAREIAIVDGAFVTLPRASKGSLLNYCCANAADEPSKALAELLKELDGSHARVSTSTLDRQFRQVVAFRDGSWADNGRANCLADTFFAQWRLAARHGFRPLRHLTQVYRGIFFVSLLARQLAPDRDSFEEGVKDLQLTKLLHDVSTMLQPSYWGDQADRIGALMVLGPRILDDALKTISERTELQNKPSVNRSTKPNLWNMPMVVMLIGMLAALWFHDRKPSNPLGWNEPLSVVVFVVLGCMLVHILSRDD